MTPFSLLAQDLHSTAVAAEKYFRENYGASRLAREETIESTLPLKPTLSGRCSDGSILCIEVSERAYSNSLDTFVVECNAKGLPVRLFVVVPSAKGDTDFAGNIQKAKQRGVGVIEIIDGGAQVFADAVSLSLFGLRRTEIRAFPKYKRDAVRLAEQTFLNGNPVKGCQSLYEELEAVTRAFAIRSKAEGWWRPAHPGETGPKTKLETGSWTAVLKELGTFCEFRRVRKTCPLFKDALISGARAVTDPRNLTSHKPRDSRTLRQRDAKLRTWFESAAELLIAWYDGTKPLKLHP